jgi:hypothetical protein
LITYELPLFPTAWAGLSAAGNAVRSYPLLTIVIVQKNVEKVNKNRDESMPKKRRKRFKNLVKNKNAWK